MGVQFMAINTVNERVILNLAYIETMRIRNGNIVVYYHHRDDPLVLMYAGTDDAIAALKEIERGIIR